MASASATMTLPVSSATQKGLTKLSYGIPFIPLPKKTLLTKAQPKSKVGINASLKEKVVTGLTAASLTASMVIPDVAHAAGSDLSPSLKNFLLSIFAGGAVLTAIFGAVIGVSNFDPVRRT